MSRLVIRWLAIGALGLGLAVLVGWTWLPDILRSRPSIAARYAPDDPRTLHRVMTLRYATNGQRLTATDYARIERSLAGAPMAADPFALLAVRATRSGDTAAATRLLEEARRRNPRHRLARLLLMERYVRDNRPDEAGIELAAINRLVPEASQLTLGAMTAMALDPRAKRALARAMSGDPGLQPLLARLVAKGAPVETVLMLARTLPAGAVESANFPWRQPLIERLIKDGRYGQARMLWRSFLGATVRPADRGVFNAGFARSDALPPFNWRLASGEVGAVELTRRNTMTVDYFGRQSGELVAQLLTLAPGRYRLSFTAEGKASAEASRLVWFVRCAAPGLRPEQGTAILTAVVDGIGGAPATRTATFTVPAAACPAQWLSLEGLAADMPSAQNLEIMRLSISPVGTGAR